MILIFLPFLYLQVSLSQTETESEFSEMDSLAYSSSTSVMSTIAYYHQRYQQLPKEEPLDKPTPARNISIDTFRLLIIAAV